MMDDERRAARVLATIMKEVRQMPTPRRTRPWWIIFLLGGAFYVASVAVMLDHPSVVMALWTWVIGSLWPDLLTLMLSRSALRGLEIIGVFGIAWVIRLRIKTSHS